MNQQTLTLLSRYLNRAEMAAVRKNVADVTGLEGRFRRRLDELLRELARQAADSLVVGQMPVLPAKEFEALYMDLMVNVSRRGLQNAQSHAPAAVATAPVMMSGRRPKLPSNLGELMRLWDHYRKRGEAPRRVKVLAERVRRAYLKKVQGVFERHSEAFRQGHVFDRSAVQAAIQEASKAPRARARMIVETETTYYYNRARRAVYDQSGDVTHYLFVAIRDAATTHWCRSRNGLVYKKGSAVLDRETPPIHWNCRSELLPLVWQNPRHRQLIQDRHIWREFRRCEPLPAGWNRDRVAA